MGIFVSNCIGSCVVIYTPQITETWGEKNQHLHRNEMNVPFFIFFCKCFECIDALNHVFKNNRHYLQSLNPVNEVGLFKQTI